jgi:hypothetical protein
MLPPACQPWHISLSLPPGWLHRGISAHLSCGSIVAERRQALPSSAHHLPCLFQGIIVFASIMAMLGLQVLVEAARDFFSSDHSFHLNSLPWVVGVMVGVTSVKLCLFLLCRLYENDIVQAYAKDHFFDVVTNSLGM